MTLPRILPLLAIGAALLGAGCGDDDDGQAGAPASTPAATASPTAAATESPAGKPVTGKDFADISDDLESEPQVDVPGGGPPTSLIAKDIVTGDGKRARPGDDLAVQYTGIAFSTGEKFDASWDRGAQPLEFTVGAQQVIPGWDQGIPGMREGGRRLLVIPSELAYGPRGQPPVIGPDETLIFVVDLVQVA